MRILLSAVFAALAGQACAGDLPSTKPPPAPPVFTAVPVAFSWTGFYAGIEGGADFMNAHGVLTKGGATAAYRDRSPGGVIGGMVGYNQQIGSLVVGVEANGDGVFGGKHRTTAMDGMGNVYAVNAQHNFDADLRGRLGFAMDRALLFAAGGVAFGNVNMGYSGAALPGGAASFNSERVGWTVGGGMEYAFTNNVIGRAEYRFTDLGSAAHVNAATGVSDKTRFESNAALLGLMYKFGAPSP